MTVDVCVCGAGESAKKRFAAAADVAVLLGCQWLDNKYTNYQTHLAHSCMQRGQLEIICI